MQKGHLLYSVVAGALAEKAKALSARRLHTEENASTAGYSARPLLHATGRAYVPAKPIRAYFQEAFRVGSIAGEVELDVFIPDLHSRWGAPSARFHHCVLQHS